MKLRCGTIEMIGEDLGIKQKIEEEHDAYIDRIVFTLQSEVEEWLNELEDICEDYGELLYKKKQYRESIEILMKGIKKSNDPIFLILVGLNYEKLQNYTLAEYFYYKAFFRVPNRLHPLYRLALLYYNSGNISKFMSMSKTIFEFEPKIESDIIKIMKKEINTIFEKVRLSCP